jgi:hypothetical protein
MTISSEQAAAALRDIEETGDRSCTLNAYEQGSPYFFLWGAIWIVGYLATAISPPSANVVWVSLWAVGIGGGVLLARRRARLAGWDAQEATTRKRFSRRLLTSWLVLIAFWMATYAILQPHETNQFSAFPALLMGAVYAFVGVIWLPRYLPVGLIVMAATVLGYFYLAPWFAYWLALVGGAGLLLTGVWLRKA